MILFYLEKDSLRLEELKNGRFKEFNFLKVAQIIRFRAVGSNPEV